MPNHSPTRRLRQPAFLPPNHPHLRLKLPFPVFRVFSGQIKSLSAFFALFVVKFPFPFAPPVSRVSHVSRSRIRLPSRVPCVLLRPTPVPLCAARFPAVFGCWHPGDSCYP